MINCNLQGLRQVLSGVVLVCVAVTAKGVDLELFEFNDPNGTELSGALNSVTSHMWTTSETDGSSDMLPSDVRVRQLSRDQGLFDGLGQNWLQIDNVYRGQGLSGGTVWRDWAFRTGRGRTDPAEGDPVRVLERRHGNRAATRLRRRCAIRPHQPRETIELARSRSGYSGPPLIPITGAVGHRSGGSVHGGAGGRLRRRTRTRSSTRTVAVPRRCWGKEPLASDPRGELGAVSRPNNNFGSTNVLPYGFIDEQFYDRPDCGQRPPIR